MTRGRYPRILASDFDEAHADRQCTFDVAHSLGGDAAESAHEALAVDGPDLVQEHDGIALEATFRRLDENFRRIEFRVEPGRDGRNGS